MIHSSLLSIFFLFLLSVGQSFASQKTWYISPFGSDSTGDGSSSNPYATVYKAYGSATDGDVIQAASGNYGGSANLITIQKNITIQSEKGPSSTIFTAQNSKAQFYLPNAHSVSFIGIQVSFSTSAAIQISGPDVKIQNCIISYNQAGIAFNGGSLLVDSTTVHDNNQGIFLTSSSYVPISIVNSVITNNGMFYADGGGLSISTSVTIKNTIIQNNIGSHGGGIYLQEASVNMIGSKMYNNTASDGGAFMCTYSSAFNIYSSSISDNTAGTGGAGDCSSCNLYVDSDCEIEDNTSTSGDNGQCTF